MMDVLAELDQLSVLQAIIVFTLMGLVASALEHYFFGGKR